MTSLRAKRHVVWICAGCDKCEPLDGSEPQNYPCTDTSPSMDGAVVVLAAEYDRLRAECDRYREALEHYADERSWLNEREHRGVPGFHSRAWALRALTSPIESKDRPEEVA